MDGLHVVVEGVSDGFDGQFSTLRRVVVLMSSGRLLVEYRPESLNPHTVDVPFSMVRGVRLSKRSSNRWPFWAELNEEDIKGEDASCPTKEAITLETELGTLVIFLEGACELEAGQALVELGRAITD